jgi:hypothetical protein
VAFDKYIVGCSDYMLGGAVAWGVTAIGVQQQSPDYPGGQVR